MSELIDRQAAIDTEGLDEKVRCEMCRNQMKTDRGCDGNCKYDEKLYEKIMQILYERIKPLPPAQPELDSETLIRTIENGITATNSNDAYSLGMRNGMRWCKSLIDGAEPKFEDDVMSVDDGKELPSVQPEPHEGHWIKHESPDGSEQYECSECGVLWEFNEGTPEDNEAYFCPKCGAKMTISTK